MSVLGRDEIIVLELLALRPIADFPPLHQPVVAKLCERGLVCHDHNGWHPSKIGLQLIRQTFH